MDSNGEFRIRKTRWHDFTAVHCAGSVFRLAAIVVLFGFSAGVALTQQPDVDESYPPPPKVIPEDERTLLESIDEVKKRTKLALELMDARMIKAEQLHDRQELDAMFLELGVFHALIDHTFEFLNSSDKDSGKVLNNFKRLEIGLRRFTPRLEVIRRDLPPRYEFYPRALVRYIRDARSRAIEPLFGNSVVPNERKP